MDDLPHIAVAKDHALRAALEQAAALNEPGTSDADLLRYLALVGAQNLPDPWTPPTPEQCQRAIEVVMEHSARWMRENGTTR